MHADLLLSYEELAARWRALAADPLAPEFYELNEFGEIILSPSPSNKHELIAFEVAKALESQLGPRASAAVSVLTDRRMVASQWLCRSATSRPQYLR
jgi:hypothetical protein